MTRIIHHVILLIMTISIFLPCLPQSMANPTNILTAPNTTIANCPRKCGDIVIPYPFGIGSDCSISSWHNIICNSTTNDQPRAFLGASANHSIEVINISETQMRVRNSLAYQCFDSKGNMTEAANGSITLTNSSFTISGTANKFVGVGCDDFAGLVGIGPRNLTAIGGCLAWCSKKEDLTDGSCSGLGCCETAFPSGMQDFLSILKAALNHTNVSSFDPCAHSFPVEDLSDKTFRTRVLRNVPVVVEWNVGDGSNCRLARNSNSYACQGNTSCSDSTWLVGGYNCNCLPGFEGNPYVPPGCTDFNECAATENPCSGICTNTVGSYECSCPKGHHGDGYKNGTPCRSWQLATKIALGVSTGILIVFFCISWVYILTRKRELIKMREKFFKQNGGLILKQQIFSSQDRTATTRIFSATELELATKNYNKERIIGEGANGVVYKGILPDNRGVAIKKSKVVDTTQIEQFINEVIVLTQINHRNVVKLLGCCLETEVPLLVYEFISNGSLFDHLHNKVPYSWLTWTNCVRIATEAADALAYLHSAASMPIIHRDVKSANILIDDSYTVKIADFGASRLVPIDQTQVNTLVQGTLGYLDPEYFQSSQLTEKSDVYSFGVVLAELLTREKPLSMERIIEERNLAMFFTVAVIKNRASEIIHPQLMKEAYQDQLVSMAMLVKRCLNLKGEDRPTMKEVAVELDGLRKQLKHPWLDQDVEATSSLLPGPLGDLYPVPRGVRIIRNLR